MSLDKYIKLLNKAVTEHDLENTHRNLVWGVAGNARSYVNEEEQFIISIIISNGDTHILVFGNNRTLAKRAFTKSD